VLVFLKMWLTNHIMKADAGYIEYLKQDSGVAADRVKAGFPRLFLLIAYPHVRLI